MTTPARPILKLKKKVVEPPALPEKVIQETPKKNLVIQFPESKEEQLLRKQQKREKNLQEMADAKARKMEKIRARRAERMAAKKEVQIHLFLPFFDVYFSDKKILHETVWVDGIECLYPLELGTHKKVLAELRQHTDCPANFGRRTLEGALSIYFYRHTNKTAYLNGLARIEERRTLDGAVSGSVSEEHRANALKTLSTWTKKPSRPAIAA